MQSINLAKNIITCDGESLPWYIHNIGGQTTYIYAYYRLRISLLQLIKLFSGMRQKRKQSYRYQPIIYRKIVTRHKLNGERVTQFISIHTSLYITNDKIKWRLLNFSLIVLFLLRNWIFIGHLHCSKTSYNV